MYSHKTVTTIVPKNGNKYKGECVFLQLLGPLFFNILMEVDDVMLILLIHQRRGNHKIGSRFIVGDRDIVNLGDSKKRLDIRIVRLGGQGIGEAKMIKLHLSPTTFAPIQGSPPRF